MGPPRPVTGIALPLLYDSLIANRKEVQTLVGFDAVIVCILVQHANPIVKSDHISGISAYASQIRAPAKQGVLVWTSVQ
jgi:hypothetical protein